MRTIDELAQQSFEIALKRGKITNSTSVADYHKEFVDGIKSEFDEYLFASDRVISEHLPDYNQREEELIDLTLVCLTELKRRGLNVEKALRLKLNFNETR